MVYTLHIHTTRPKREYTYLEHHLGVLAEHGRNALAVVRAAGDLGAANALQKLHVGLGEPAGAHEVPGGGAWTLRVI